MSSVARSLPRAPLRGLGSAVARAGLCGLLIVVTVGISTRVPSPSILTMVAACGFLAAGAWMFFSERYELTLAVLALYLGLADGYLKLKTGSTAATLGRDLLFYSIVAGAVARIVIRRTPLRAPPLTGWVLAFTLIVVASVFNPGSAPTTHALASTRPHIEFVALFFFGYVVMRSRRRLQAFLVILLIVGAANGVVTVIQSGLSPAELSNWGPGYRERIEGSGGSAGRNFAGANGETKVRPFGLGADAGGGGLIACLGLPAAFALIGLARRRTKLAALAVVALLGMVGAVVASQGRGVVLAAFIVVFAYVLLSVTSKRLVPTLAGVVLGGTIAALVVSSLAGGNDFSRYDSIAPTKVLGTAQKDRGGAISIVPKYMVEYPFGAGLGSAGPATGFGGGQTRDLNGESEFSYLVIEIGIAGFLAIIGFSLRLLLLGLVRLRRVADPELRVLLAAIISPLFGIVGLYVGGAPTAGSPLGPYLWFVGGIMAAWLLGPGTSSRRLLRATRASGGDFTVASTIA